MTTDQDKKFASDFHEVMKEVLGDRGTIEVNVQRMSMLVHLNDSSSKERLRLEVRLDDVKRALEHAYNSWAAVDKKSMAAVAKQLLAAIVSTKGEITALAQKLGDYGSSAEGLLPRLTTVSGRAVKHLKFAIEQVKEHNTSTTDRQKMAALCGYAPIITNLPGYPAEVAAQTIYYERHMGISDLQRVTCQMWEVEEDDVSDRGFANLAALVQLSEEDTPEQILDIIEKESLLPNVIQEAPGVLRLQSSSASHSLLMMNKLFMSLGWFALDEAGLLKSGHYSKVPLFVLMANSGATIIANAGDFDAVLQAVRVWDAQRPLSDASDFNFVPLVFHRDSQSWFKGVDIGSCRHFINTILACYKGETDKNKRSLRAVFTKSVIDIMQSITEQHKYIEEYSLLLNERYSDVSPIVQDPILPIITDGGWVVPMTMITNRPNTIVSSAPVSYISLGNGRYVPGLMSKMFEVAGHKFYRPPFAKVPVLQEPLTEKEINLITASYEPPSIEGFALGGVKSLEELTGEKVINQLRTRVTEYMKPLTEKEAASSEVDDLFS